MEFLKQPKAMCLEGDVGENWKKNKNNFELYAVATGCKHRGKNVHAAVLLHCLGEQAYEIFEVLEVSKEDRQDPEAIIKLLNNHFPPKSNPSVETRKFINRNAG